MKIHQFTADIFEQPMTRKEFLQHVAVAGVLLLGGGYILNMFTNFERNTPKKGAGYSMGAYGGGVESPLNR